MCLKRKKNRFLTSGPCSPAVPGGPGAPASPWGGRVKIIEILI